MGDIWIKVSARPDTKVAIVETSHHSMYSNIFALFFLMDCSSPLHVGWRGVFSPVVLQPLCGLLRHATFVPKYPHIDMSYTYRKNIKCVYNINRQFYLIFIIIDHSQCLCAYVLIFHFGTNKLPSFGSESIVENSS